MEPEPDAPPPAGRGAFLSAPSRRANAEIAQVRGQAQQEQAAFQASLRKGQLRVDALERTLEQKVRVWPGRAGRTLGCLGWGTRRVQPHSISERDAAVLP